MSSLGFEDNKNDVLEPDLSNYFEAIGETKENYQPDDDTIEDESEDDAEKKYLSQEEIKTATENFKFSKNIAGIFVEFTDMAMSGVASIIAKETQEGASKQEKEPLTDAWANFLKDKNADISPGWILLAMVLMVYAPKLWNARQCRKLKLENEQKDKEIESLKKELERRKKQYNE